MRNIAYAVQYAKAKSLNKAQIMFFIGKEKQGNNALSRKNKNYTPAMRTNENGIFMVCFLCEALSFTQSFRESLFCFDTRKRI